jgi:hypothetical protein
MKDRKDPKSQSGPEKPRQTLDAMVEDALVSMSVVAPPADLARKVMSQVQKTPQLPAFRLTWLDLTLSAFVAVMLLLIVILGSALPPELALYLRQELLYWSMRLQLDPLTPILIIGAAALLVGGTLLLIAMLARYFIRREGLSI